MKYTYEEVIAQSEEYFNGDSLAARVFADKYALKDYNGNYLEVTPEDMHRRIAKEFARIEKKKFKNPLTEQEIFDLLDEFKYLIPQGSPMYGIGNKYQYVSLGNCFVIPSPLDSYLGIMNTDTQITQISCRRGGVGWDVSNLRPSGTNVKNAAKTTSGVVEFMKRFSNSIREVGQAGRRGASLQSISVKHPDILEFITIKQQLDQITGSNISVKFTDEFMSCLEKDKDFELRWPITGKAKITRSVKAKELWKEFVHSAWLMGEPGCMFEDRVLEESTGVPYGHIETSSNPCQPKWAKFCTKNGIRKLEDISIGDEIWSSEGWTKVLNKWSTGKKEVYKYITTAGIFYGTENHRIMSDGQKIEIKDSESIDILSGPSIQSLDCPQFYPINCAIIPSLVMDGIVMGDGSVHKASNDLVHLYIGKDDQSYFDSEIKDLILKHRPGLSKYAYEIETSITSEELPYTYLRRVPDRYLYGKSSVVVSFLRGLYSANGSVCGNRITLKSASFGLIEDVQLMLSSVGIKSYWTKNKPTIAPFENGDYLCKESYDLNISVDRERFVNLIGFIQDYKNIKIEIKAPKRSKQTYDIISIELISNEEVFDITVDNKSHTYWTQGCNVSNCGEQFLPPYASCRLLLINLYSYVINKFQDDARFDFDLFKSHVKILQRLGDNLVDLEIEAIDNILDKIRSDPEPDEVKQPALILWNRVRETALLDRRTGCGFTALGDTIAALGMKYASEECLDFVEKMQKEFKFSAYESSVDMAEELGPFPQYDKNKDIKSKFIQRIRDENIELYNRMCKYGRRNLVLLTIAPTGSVSCLTQTSSGLEPVFLLSYTRRKKGNLGDSGFRTDFIDQNGDRWMEFTVYHKGFQDWMDITGLSKVEESPYFMSTANEIDWINRVKLQACLQRHIDNSISSTVNLPNEISEEKVGEIYFEAWKQNLKGITVYRDGCRTGVLVKKEVIPRHDAPKRPDSLECDVHKISVKGEPYFVLIGKLEGCPYEVFAGKDGFIDQEVHSGKIVKIKRPKGYKALLDDDSIISPLHAMVSDNEEAVLRMTSTALRHGSDIKFICEQLSKVRGEMNSLARAISRTLKTYIKDGTISTEMCKECNVRLIYQAGCSLCPNCGSSKCS